MRQGRSKRLGPLLRTVSCLKGSLLQPNSACSPQRLRPPVCKGNTRISRRLNVHELAVLYGMVYTVAQPDFPDCSNYWIANHNKQPLNEEGLYARELFSREAARRHFLSKVGELQLAASGGYIRNMDWCIQWDHDWTSQAHPGRVLQAARQSCSPPCERALYRWVRLFYPAWLQHFWPTTKQHATYVELEAMD